jgi:anaerobic selenocysteine-containing dehydrogenase
MCGNRCSIAIHIEEGIMIDVRPLEGNPVNKDRMCPRGKACLDVFYHADRVRKPLKRQPDGTFMEIGREQALDEIARKMLDLKDQWGARSTGVWKGEAVGFLQQE